MNTGMNLRKIEKPFAFIIFGASGDLAQLKIFPSIYSLAEQKRLPKEYIIIGFARSHFEESAFRELFAQSVRKHFKEGTNEAVLEEIVSHVTYISGQYGDSVAYERLKTVIIKHDHHKQWQKVIYLAIPPTVFDTVAANVAVIREKNEEIKIIIEKPLGVDSTSARHLFHQISLHFNEAEIYLLDHYLGKEAIQSILSLRYANRMLNHMLTGSEIANIQITAFENIGVGKRLGYFDEVGIIRDMIQSHLLQVLALVTMSIPVKESALSFQREKNNVLASLHFADKIRNPLCIGQYASYRQEAEQVKNSTTETFAAMTLFIDQVHWYNVPIFIRTGKKMAKKRTEVVIEFKKLPFQKADLPPNRLILNIQPHEQIEIQLLNKVGGTHTAYRTLTTSDSLACFGDDCLPEHARLLMDVIQGRKMFFLSFQEVLACWDLIDEVIAYKNAKPSALITYPDGAAEISEANELPETFGFNWYAHAG
ncbi:MAG: glucose-6-phosphate dehydrogenase [Candidatus Abawacabacteria bacterium]|nr:glucose-6-phosphate dehydrogenase [Candidatus Abawacabacteria bacterium]